MFNGKLKALTFSYDDGVTPDERLIEILNKYGMKGTFNINTGKHPKTGDRPYFDRNGARIGHFTWDELKDIYKGHEVAVHTVTHPHLENISREDCIREVADDIANIEAAIGKRPVGMAYPFGTYNDNVVDVLAELGVKYSRTTRATNSFDLQTDLLRFHPTCHHNAANLMELAKTFVELKPETPKLFYVWGHSYEFECDKNWDIIERFCDYMAGHDDIFYGTNEETLL